MGNVHNPALSLHLRFFLWAVCFPTCCSECLIILSSLRWTEQCQTGEVVGQGEMDRWMDGWMGLTDTQLDIDNATEGKKQSKGIKDWHCVDLCVWWP